MRVIGRTKEARKIEEQNAFNKLRFFSFCYFPSLIISVKRKPISTQYTVLSLPEQFRYQSSFPNPLLQITIQSHIRCILQRKTTPQKIEICIKWKPMVWTARWSKPLHQYHKQGTIQTKNGHYTARQQIGLVLKAICPDKAWKESLLGVPCKLNWKLSRFEVGSWIEMNFD